MAYTSHVTLKSRMRCRWPLAWRCSRQLALSRLSTMHYFYRITARDDDKRMQRRMHARRSPAFNFSAHHRDTHATRTHHRSTRWIQNAVARAETGPREKFVGILAPKTMFHAFSLYARSSEERVVRPATPGA